MASEFTTNHTGVKGWIDHRLPVFTFMDHSLNEYPTPKNLSYWWNFGSSGWNLPGHHDSIRHLSSDELCLQHHAGV